MGFFDRNREDVVKRGYDGNRLPSGQYLTERFPVLHVGDVPTYKPGEWDLKIFGAVNNEFTLKRLYRRGGVVKLVPENKMYPPIVLKPDDELRIVGVVTFNLHKLT